AERHHLLTRREEAVHHRYRVHRRSEQPVAYPRVRCGYPEWQTVERQGLCGNAEAEHHRWTARRPGRPHLVLRRLGRSERERCSLLLPDRRSDRQDPHTGDGGQFVLRWPAAKPNVHLRLDVALCSLHECPGRYEAMTSCEASTVT